MLVDRAVAVAKLVRTPRRRPDLSKAEIAKIHVVYAPERDGEPDPGEVCWAWVPFEEDASQGKDRPVLIIGTVAESSELAALALTGSPRRGRYLLGRGGWDGRRKVSWVKLDELLRISANHVRREGAMLERPRFDALIEAMRARHGLLDAAPDTLRQ